MKRLLACSVLALAIPASASAQTSAPPDPPVIVAPKDGYSRALPGKITFRVRAMPNEPAGSLGIELKTEDANPHQPNVNDGRYDEDDPYWAGSYGLVETEPGSGVYEVTVDFEGDRDFPTDFGYYWHAYRVLTAGENCTPRGDGYDCFQETEEREFVVGDPESHGANEPKNDRARGATRNEGLSTDGWLERSRDVDWYRFRGKGTKLVIHAGNDFRGTVPSGESVDIVFRIYRAGRSRPILRRVLRKGDREVTLRGTVRAGAKYYVKVHHAKTDKRRAPNVPYSFYIEKGVAG